jgi:hypothetical protein
MAEKGEDKFQFKKVLEFVTREEGKFNVLKSFFRNAAET